METLKDLEPVKTAKKARTTARSALTRVANQLKSSLVLNEGGKYDFSKLDKFSIKADADKLVASLGNLQTANEAYLKVCQDELVKLEKESEELFNKLEEDSANYWLEARKEATILLNLYKYEYSTALTRYLQNIDEEGKTATVSKVTTGEAQKQKREAEKDLVRQLHRWNLRKADWFAILEQTEQEIDGKTASPSKEDSLIDAIKRIEDIRTQWTEIKGFMDTLWDAFSSMEVEKVDAEGRINFEFDKEARRMRLVLSKLEALSLSVQGRSVTSVSEKANSSDKARLKMDKIQTPRFTGKAEDFALWKERFCSLVPKGRDDAETAVLLEQSIPENKRYLLRDCGQDYQEMLEVLRKELAPTRDVVNSINLQLSKLKKIMPEDKESDKKFVYMVESIEKMQRDLKAIDRISVLANINTIQEIEGKLPQLVKTDWFKRKRENNLDEKTDDEKFKDFMIFLSDYKYIAKDGVAEFERAKATNARSYTALVTGTCMNISAKVPPKNPKAFIPRPNEEFCLACQDGATNSNVSKHSTFTCEHWLSLSMPERKRLVKCEYHPRTSNHNTKDCKFKKPRQACRYCQSPDHHALFCPAHKSTSQLSMAARVYVTDAPSEVTEGLQASVLLPFVYAKIENKNAYGRSKAIRLGVLLDNCATDVWITFSAARKLGLEGRNITISAGGFGGKRELLRSKLYSVGIHTKDGVQMLECLGVEKIGNDETPPDKERYSTMCEKFEVEESLVARPTKIDVLIGQRANHLHAEKIIKAIDGMKLRKGPLGHTFAGIDNSGSLGGGQLSSNYLTSSIIQHPVYTVDESKIKEEPDS